MKIELVNIKSKYLNDVIILGKKNSKTLGLFPEGAFHEHARKNCILGAVDEGKLMGYLLFAIVKTKGCIRIVQLCVDDQQRGKGVSKLLLDTLKDKYQSLLKGISLSCREDYEHASKLWQSSGFKAIGRTRSRSQKERYLIKWWFDLGTPDLFSRLCELDTKAAALLDANILFKLRDNVPEENSESSFLLADWLAESVEYYVAPETYNEITRDKNKLRADESRNYIKNYFELARFTENDRNVILPELKEIISGNSENDESDRKQIAECLAAGIDYFITEDSGILDASEELLLKYGLKVFRPTDFILAIDQLNNKTNYIATKVAGANYDYSPIQSGELEQIAMEFLCKNKGEKKHEIKKAITNVVPDLMKSEFRVVKDLKQNKIGFWCAHVEDNSFEVDLIRVKNGRLGTVLFKQMINDIIKVSLDKSKGIIRISDKYLLDEYYSSLLAYGFYQTKEGWEKVSITGVIKTNEIEHQLPLEANTDKFKEIISTINDSGDTILSDKYKFELERLLWPVKFLDLELPTYIIPIKPHWAEALFDSHAANTKLFGTNVELHWNSENVYYRSVNPVSEIAPGRILWYVSNDNKNHTGRTRGIVACSYLKEVHIGSAKSLYQSFKQYGIYQWNDIYSLAKNDAYKEIKALKFDNTEVFNEIISLKKIEKVFVGNGQKKNTFASPVIISNIIFEELYRIGKKLNEEDYLNIS